MQDSKRVQISDQPLNRQNPLNRQYILNKIYPCHCTGWLNTLCHTSNQHFFEQKIWETAVRKQESDFFGGETSVGKQVSAFLGGKQVSGKQASGYSSRKQVSGNRCLDSFWKQVSGNRCLVSFWKQVSGITGVLIPC